MKGRNRARDTVSNGTLHLDTTRPFRLSPVTFTFQAPQVQVTDYARPVEIARLTRVYQPPVVHGATARSVATNAPGNLPATRTPATSIAKAVKVCEDRQVRREVLFAYGKGGRNGQRTAKFTNNSKVKC